MFRPPKLDVEHQGSHELGVKRRLRLIERVNKPAPVRRIFGNLVTIEEQSEFDPAARCWLYRMVPAGLSYRIDIQGSVRLSSHASGVEQISETNLSCLLFELGASIEPFMAHSTERGHIDRTAFTRRFIVEKQRR